MGGWGACGLVLACCAALVVAARAWTPDSATVSTDRAQQFLLMEHIERTLGHRLMRVLQGFVLASTVCLAVLAVLTAVVRCWLDRSHPVHVPPVSTATPEKVPKNVKTKKAKGKCTIKVKVKKEKRVHSKWPRAYSLRYLRLLARLKLEQEAALAALGRDPQCQRLREQHASLTRLQDECSAAMERSREALRDLVARCAALGDDVAAALAARPPEEVSLLQTHAEECAALVAQLEAKDEENRRLRSQLTAQLDEMTQLSNAVTRLQQRNAQLAERLHIQQQQQQQQQRWRRDVGPSLPLFSGSSSCGATAAVGPPGGARVEDGDCEDGYEDDDGYDEGPDPGYFLTDLDPVPRLF